MTHSTDPQEGFAFNFALGTSAIFFVITIFIYLPLCFYGLLMYYKYRQNLIIKKRHYKIGMLFGVLMVILITLSATMQLSLGQWYSYESYGSWLLNPYFILSTLVSNIFVLRIWLNYYDIKYSKALTSSQWKCLITKKYTNQQNDNWYIVNRKYGNSKFWIKYYILPFLLIHLTLVIIIESVFWESRFHQTDQLAFIQNLLCVPPVIIQAICVGIIMKKTPKFDDAFFIKSEIKYCLYTLCGIISLNGPLVLTFYVFNPSEIILNILSIFVMFGYASGHCMIILITTIWTIHINQKWLNLFGGKQSDEIPTSINTLNSLSSLQSVNTDDAVVNTLHLSTFSDNTLDDNVPSRSQAHSATSMTNTTTTTATTTSSTTTTNNITNLHDIELLFKILKNQQSFEAFIFHLAQEFSTEIIISLIEFTQFKHRMFERFDILKTFKNALRDEDILAFPEGVPKSDIVWDEIDDGFDDEAYKQIINDIKQRDRNDLNEKEYINFKIRAYKLFNKYIAEGGDAEINISFHMRQKLCNKMQNLDEWVSYSNHSVFTVRLDLLYRVFDDCIEEMVKLLGYSLVRFQNSSLFHKLQQDVLVNET